MPGVQAGSPAVTSFLPSAALGMQTGLSLGLPLGLSAVAGLPAAQQMAILQQQQQQQVEQQLLQQQSPAMANGVPPSISATLGVASSSSSAAASEAAGAPLMAPHLQLPAQQVSTVPIGQYPGHVNVDFHKLPSSTLKKYAWYFSLPRPPRIPDLAALCAQHFGQPSLLDEEQILCDFSDYTRTISRHERRSSGSLVQASGRHNGGGGGGGTGGAEGDDYSVSGRQGSGSSHHRNGGSASGGGGGGGGASGKSAGKKRSSASSNSENKSQDGQSAKRKRPNTPFRVLESGTRAAALIKDDWVLTNVVKYNKRKKTYDLEDADEEAEQRQISDVKREYVLGLPSEGDIEDQDVLADGTRVLAMYPGTTSFYPAEIVRMAKTKVRAYFVYFDDDEDDDGTLRQMRVNASLCVFLPPEWEASS